MKELTQVREAVIAVLKDAGMTALAAYPDQRAKQYSGAVAAVSVGAAEGKTMGFCNYLGEVYDEAAGTVQELYGKLLEGNITVDIRAERAADCEAGCPAESAPVSCDGMLCSGSEPRGCFCAGAVCAVRLFSLHRDRRTVRSFWTLF